MSQKIICFHRLDDYSGSPLILSNLIKHWVQHNRQVELYTAIKGRKGFLSGITGVTYYHVPYKKFSIKIFTLLYFFFSQLVLFFRLLKYRNEQVVFYVNAMLPFAAAIAGKLMKKKVVYHIHEVSISPVILHNFLTEIAYKTATDAIFVSNYVKEQFNFKDANTFVVYNALSKEFVNIANSHIPPKKENEFQVLMVCSLKDFKGVWEFLKLSKELPYLQFQLVLNAKDNLINKIFGKTQLPDNLIIHSSSSNMHPYYERADLLLNLSHPDKWIETFGLTVLEAMHYCKPAIVPPVGGIIELVEDGINGYQISVHDFENLKYKIQEIAIDKNLYLRLSRNSIAKSKSFKYDMMIKDIEKILIRPKP